MLSNWKLKGETKDPINLYPPLSLVVMSLWRGENIFTWGVIFNRWIVPWVIGFMFKNSLFYHFHCCVATSLHGQTLCFKFQHCKRSLFLSLYTNRCARKRHFGVHAPELGRVMCSVCMKDDTHGGNQMPKIRRTRLSALSHFGEQILTQFRLNH